MGSCFYYFTYPNNKNKLRYLMMMFILTTLIFLLFSSETWGNVVDVQGLFILSATDMKPNALPPVLWINRETKHILHCANLCLIQKSCFMFCFNQVGFCPLSVYGLPPNTIPDYQPANKSFKYDCYIRNEYWKTELGLKLETVLSMAGSLSAAFLKKGGQSSICCGDPSFDVSKLTDDKYSTDFLGAKTCMSTSVNGDDPKPWIFIDMERNYLVLAVNISNRSPDVGGRFHDVDVRVGVHSWNNKTNVDFQLNQLCFNYNEAGTQGLYLFRLCEPNPVIGQYLSMQIVRPCGDKPGCNVADGDINVITLCEVQVYAFNV